MPGVVAVVVVVVVGGDVLAVEGGGQAGICRKRRRADTEILDFALRKVSQRPQKSRRNIYSQSTPEIEHSQIFLVPTHATERKNNSPSAGTPNPEEMARQRRSLA